MKTLHKIIALTTFLAIPTFAQDNPQHGNNIPDDAKEKRDQRMTSMQDHMKEMHALMEKIKTEKDPEKRMELMEQHMNAMHTGMNKMSMNMSASDQTGKKNQDMAPMNMDRCMSMMREHRNMMQGMMDQMKEYQTQEKRLRKQIHKE